MQTLANVACGDSYTDAATLQVSSNVKSISVLVANNSVVMQVRANNSVESAWGPEIPVAPSTFSISDAWGVRFRNAVPGSTARVVAVLMQPEDPSISASTVYSSILSASGAVSRAAGLISHTPLTVSQGITAASEAAAQIVVAAPSLQADGLTPLKIEFFAPRLLSTNPSQCVIVLYEDATSLGLINHLDGNIGWGVYCMARITPAAGVKVYSIRAYRTAAVAVTIFAGVGGVGAYTNAFIRVSTDPVS